jgi:hypothetical protein
VQDIARAVLHDAQSSHPFYGAVHVGLLVGFHYYLSHRLPNPTSDDISSEQHRMMQQDCASDPDI